eukprot:2007113-Lingulodinium_polyedra.AAC.1
MRGYFSSPVELILCCKPHDCSVVCCAERRSASVLHNLSWRLTGSRASESESCALVCLWVCW